MVICCLGFELLDGSDQNTLLSSSSVEVMFLLLAQQFSENPTSVSNGNNIHYHIICLLSLTSCLFSKRTVLTYIHYYRKILIFILKFHLARHIQLLWIVKILVSGTMLVFKSLALSCVLKVNCATKALRMSLEMEISTHMTHCYVFYHQLYTKQIWIAWTLIGWKL